MNERRQDFEWLQRFARDGEQGAFTDLVRRHLDLVLATALRKVEDPGAAQEVSQNVFVALARKAWRFAPEDSLPAWLHKAALLESKSWLRGELGRRRREQTAVELGTTMNTSEDQPAFNALVPLLDDGLLSLREKDRTALLLRFYENQSLRDVGGSLGVNEDAARKRVQSALEKLAEFFQRRGFRTATVAAAAAALQQTTTSASPAMVSTIVRAALQVAPPALAGLGAWLARLVSLSRVQTAAVCVALTAVPVAWQSNERRAAGEDAERMRTQLLAAQNEGATVQAERERLRASSGRLEQSVAQANEAAARAAASAQAFDVWKQKTRGLLTVADYRWSDDSAFVRLPKAILPQLSERGGAEPFSPPGVVNSYARELLGLTPAERHSLEDRLERHFTDLADLEQKRDATIIETNRPPGGRVVAATDFIVPGLPEDEVKQCGERLLAELRSVVGEERWPVVQARLDGPRGDVLTFGYAASTLRNLLIPGAGGQKLEARVEVDDQGVPRWGYVWSPGSFQNGLLSMFLPEGEPRRTDGADGVGVELPNALRPRALAWWQEQAAVQLGGKGKP